MRVDIYIYISDISTSPFMSIREGTKRKVSFDTIDKLGDKMDKLTVMLGRLAAKDNHDRRGRNIIEIYKTSS